MLTNYVTFTLQIVNVMMLEKCSGFLCWRWKNFDDVFSRFDRRPARYIASIARVKCVTFLLWCIID